MEELSVKKLPLAQQSDSLLKKPQEKAFDIVESIKNKAEIFGISAKELESEFVNYKTKKVLQRLDLIINSGSNERFLREKIACAKKMGFGSVTVTPKHVKLAKNLISGNQIMVNTAIDYEAESLDNVKIYSAKAIKGMGVSGANYPINSTNLLPENAKSTQKTLKKLKALCRKMKLRVCFEISEMTQSDILALVKICQAVSVDTFLVTATANDTQKLRHLFSSCQGKINVEIVCKNQLDFASMMLAMGAKKVSSSFADEIGLELLEKLKNS